VLRTAAKTILGSFKAKKNHGRVAGSAAVLRLIQEIHLLNDAEVELPGHPTKVLPSREMKK